MAYCKYKDLEKIPQSDNVLKDKAFAITNKPKYDGCQRGLASIQWSIIFLTRNQKEVVLVLKAIFGLFI